MEKAYYSLVKDPKISVRDNILGEFGNVGERSLMLTDGSWKYIWYEKDGYELLLILKGDPNEMRNIANKEPYLRDQWRNELVQVLSYRENESCCRRWKINSIFTWI